MPFACECLDLGYLDRWRAGGETKAEVMGLLVAHLADEHGIAQATSTLTTYLQRYIHKIDADEEQAGNATRVRTLLETPTQAWNWFENLFRDDATRSTE